MTTLFWTLIRRWFAADLLLTSMIRHWIVIESSLIRQWRHWFLIDLPLKSKANKCKEIFLLFKCCHSFCLNSSPFFKLPTLVCLNWNWANFHNVFSYFRQILRPFQSPKRWLIQLRLRSPPQLRANQLASFCSNKTLRRLWNQAQMEAQKWQKPLDCFRWLFSPSFCAYLLSRTRCEADAKN